MSKKHEPLSWSERCKDARWQKVSANVRELAGETCEDCSRKAGDGRFHFEIHHCAYVTGKEPWEYPQDLLICLCPDCHKKRQQLEDAFRVALGKITRWLPVAQLEDEVWKMLEEVSLRETSRLASSFGGDQ